MNADDLKQAWQAQTSEPRLMIDVEVVLRMVQQHHRQFTAMAFWRDVIEVTVGVLLVPLWLFLGVWLSLPWTWYLALPGIIWGFVFTVMYRWRHRRQSTEPGETMRQRVQAMIADVESRIWLLRNVVWWCLLPLTPPMLAFVAQIYWESRHTGWPAALGSAFTAIVIVGVHAWVYWVNQHTITSQLEPRRQELEALLRALEDASPQ